MIALLALVALMQAEAPRLERIVLRAGRIVTVSGAEIENGQLLIENGKILSVGSAVDLPAGATLIDAGKGAWIVPGFIDAHTHLGSAFDAEEATEAMTPEAKAVEAFMSRHADVRAALASGVTTAALSPGNGNVVGGRIGIVKLSGERYDRVLRRDAAALKCSLGLEALRPDRDPTSRTGAVAMLRSRLGGLPKLPLFIHASRRGEIESALDLGKEAGLPVVLLHASAAAERPERAAASAGVALGPLFVSDSRQTLAAPGILARAGVAVAFVSDAPRSPEDQLRCSAAFAIKYGMNREAALRALTLVPARMLGLAKDLGSLEPGKDADLVIWSGDPLSLASDVELVVIEGRVTWRKGGKP